MSGEDWRVEARALRKQGVSYREIGHRLGLSPTTVHVALNPLPCKRCGQPANRRSDHCRRCRIVVDRERRVARGQRIARWWAEGLSRRQIAERLGRTENYVGVEIVWLRANGVRIPYRRKQMNGVPFEDAA